MTKEASIIAILSDLKLREERPLSPEEEQLLKLATSPEEQFYQDIIQLFAQNTDK